MPERTPLPYPATPYEPPRIEQTLSAAELTAEILYAGVISADAG
jgi:hypothetical protein